MLGGWCLAIGLGHVVKQVLLHGASCLLTGGQQPHVVVAAALPDCVWDGFTMQIATKPDTHLQLQINRLLLQPN
jgi:hypothetical protein